MISMSKVTERIKQRSSESEEFRLAYEAEKMKLDLTDLIYELRQQTGSSQTDFAKKVNKSRSTIARIEKGTMEPSFNLISDVVAKLDKKIEISVVDL